MGRRLSDPSHFSRMFAWVRIVALSAQRARRAPSTEGGLTRKEARFTQGTHRFGNECKNACAQRFGVAVAIDVDAISENDDVAFGCRIDPEYRAGVARMAIRANGWKVVTVGCQRRREIPAEPARMWC